MLRIHFLNVGHGDWTVIEHPSGRVTVVDINNAVSLDVDSHREISTAVRPLPSLGATILLGIATGLAIFRMDRFGRRYARELFVQFLQLPTQEMP